MGGILVGYELAKSLNCNFVFYERINNEFELRRGFELEEYSNVLFVEDEVAYNLKRGTALEFDNNLIHAGGNIGYQDRYVMTVTGWQNGQ